MSVAYVPLRVFSSFTMLEGAIEPKAIAKHAAKLGFPLHDAAVRAALTADGAASWEAGAREGWVLLVGPRWLRR